MPGMTVAVCDVLGSMADQIEYDTGRRPSLEEMYEQEFGDPMGGYSPNDGLDLYGSDYDAWVKENPGWPTEAEIERMCDKDQPF